MQPTLFAAGANEVFEVGKLLFPDFMSGEFKFNHDIGKFDGYSVNFPPNFDVTGYFEQERIDYSNIIQQSGLISRLKQHKINDTTGARLVIDGFVESVNVAFNESRGISGAHNFILGPQWDYQRD